MAASESSAAPSCPECDGVVATDDQEHVCQDCGLVVDEDRIDHGPEWSAFDPGDRDEKSRVGAPASAAMHDKGLSTWIGRDDVDANGNAIGGRKRRQLARLRREDNRGRFDSKRERIRARAFGEIQRMASALEADFDRAEQACQLFKQAHEADVPRGRGYEQVGAASLYAVARIHRDPVLLGDVVAVARVDRQGIASAYRAMDRELGIPAPPPHPRQYVGRLCSDLDVDQDVRRRAEDLVDAVVDATTPSGCKPQGIAAACVYRAGRELLGWEARPSQVDVAEAGGVTDATLRKRLGDLDGALEEEQ